MKNYSTLVKLNNLLIITKFFTKLNSNLDEFQESKTLQTSLQNVNKV